MTIILRPEHEELIAKAMQTGAYRDPDEVIGRALEMLHSEDEWLHGQKEEIAERSSVPSDNSNAVSSFLPKSHGPIWLSANRCGLVNRSADGNAVQRFL